MMTAPAWKERIPAKETKSVLWISFIGGNMEIRIQGLAAQDDLRYRR